MLKIYYINIYYIIPLIFNEGESIGKNAGKAICEVSAKIAGLTVGAVTGFTKAEFSTRKFEY